jgi:alginate O-acetyltransferase complex protein AlgI
MIFSSIDFIIFFSILIIILQCLKSSNETLKKGVLLSASYFFYGYWNWRFLGLIFLTTGVNYFCGNKIAGSTLSWDKKFWLLLSLIANLGILSFFKYYNFFIDSIHSILPLERFPLRNLDIVLPLGISFFTFQAMGFTIDVYRQKIKPIKKLDFALFIGFFPQLLAGPISRASQFFPQLNNKISLRSDNFKNGFRQFLIGFMKKTLFADSLSIFVNEIYGNVSLFDRTTVMAAVIAYSFQIYCDFSGYSDMAIGAARILGFELPVNFRHPYRSRNVGEFWRRWHISLSSWLRDYLYIPLGGNRRGNYRTYANLLVTMALGGLWHGANWTFVLWGVFHGVMLMVHRFYLAFFSLTETTSKDPFQKPFYISQIIKDIASVLTTYTLVCIAWILFRSKDIFAAGKILKIMVAGNDGIHWIHISFYLIIPLFFVWQLYPKAEELKQNLIGFDSLKGLVVTIAVICLIIFFSPVGSSPFIYFKF